MKKQYQADKKIKDHQQLKKTSKETSQKESKSDVQNELIKNFIEEKQKYEKIKTKIPKKGAHREDFTLNLLSKFRTKLDGIKQKKENSQRKEERIDDVIVEKEIQGDDWLYHTLRFNDENPILAKDASTKGDDWYDVYDPRNPLNKRKRKEVSDNRRKSFYQKSMHGKNQT